MARFKNGTKVRQNKENLMVEERPCGRKNPNYFYGIIKGGKFVLEETASVEQVKKVCDAGCEIQTTPYADFRQVIEQATQGFQDQIRAEVTAQVIAQIREQAKNVLSKGFLDSIEANIKSTTK